MILTNDKALSWVSNPGIIAAVPELATAFEEVKEAERKDQAIIGPGCKTCQAKKAAAVNKIRSNAINYIVQLSPDAIQRLKNAVNDQSLYAYLPVPGKQPEFRKL